MTTDRQNIFSSLEDSSNNNLRHLDLIPMKFWSNSGDIPPATASRQTSEPVPATQFSPSQSSYILSIRCPTSYTPPTCKSQHDELLRLSLFVQDDDADSPRVLRSYPYTEN